MNDQTSISNESSNSSLPPPLPPRIPPKRPHQLTSNTESMASKALVPEGVKGWCWGGFLLNWIWAIRFRVWIGVLALVPLIGFGVMVWLGFRGRQLAWQKQPWPSLDEFNRVQRRWSTWGAIATAVGIAALAGSFVYTAMTSGDQFSDAKKLLTQPELSLAPTELTSSASTEVEVRGSLNPMDPDLPTRIETVGGVIEQQWTRDGGNTILLNGEKLFHGDDAPYHHLIKKFHLPDGSDAVLLTSMGGRGVSCEALYFFLLIDAKRIRYTPEFGTCSPNGSYEQRGSVITVTLPRLGGMSTSQFANGTVTEDGKLLTLENSEDPSK